MRTTYDTKIYFRSPLPLTSSYFDQETQDRINELSFGIVNDFREGQKNKLKRTFVSGSDAANRKVNRL